MILCTMITQFTRLAPIPKISGIPYTRYNIIIVLLYFIISDGAVERKRRPTLTIAHRSRRQSSGLVAKQPAVGRRANLSDRFSDSSQRSSYDDHAPSAVPSVSQHHSHGTIER